MNTIVSKIINRKLQPKLFCDFYEEYLNIGKDNFVNKYGFIIKTINYKTIKSMEKLFGIMDCFPIDDNLNIIINENNEVCVDYTFECLTRSIMNNNNKGSNMNIKIKIKRFKQSYEYKYNLTKNDYKNNTRNNMIDLFQLVSSTGEILFEANVQTISNHPIMKHSDTVREGSFGVECFVDQRSFNTPIHGIIDGYDISGQVIDKYSMQLDHGQRIGRWLIHSSYYKSIKKDTKGFSGGCFIMSTVNILRLNDVLIKNGVKQNQVIEGYLKEV